jgi:hypothetical protein
MIKHIVMWNVRGETPEEKARVAGEIKAAFEGMRGKIPGMLCLEIGVDISNVSYACDVVLYSTFDSRASLAAYAEHPEHLRVKQRVEGMRITRHQVDYQISPDDEVDRTSTQEIRTQEI